MLIKSGLPQPRASGATKGVALSEEVLNRIPGVSDTQVPRLAKPVRITDQAWPESAVPVVSIISLAYNHEAYIRDCLEGFLMQETTFPVEILIHDDASTDNTANIIREYEARYPRLIKSICRTENQFSKGKVGAPLHAYPGKRGEYIANCEADDYWTDPSKLQKQVDFLDRNPDYVMCYHDAKIIDESGNVVAESKLPEVDRRDFSSTELMKGAWTLSLSRVTRNVTTKAEKEAPAKPLRVLNLDIVSTALVGKYGKGKYLGDIKPAVYRLHPSSIWSSLDQDTKHLENFNTFIHIFLYHLRATGQEFAVEFLFERVFPLFALLYPDRNPICALRREKERAEQRYRELAQVDLRKSYTYRVGAAVLWPLKKVRSLWRAVRNRAPAR
jgi:glycosyltransferase involved in cell wall biosynthesis